MRLDLMLKAAQSVLPPLDFPTASGRGTERAGQESRGPETKTTILAFHFRNGVMCASDRKVSNYGFGVHSQDMVKMWQVSHPTPSCLAVESSARSR